MNHGHHHQRAASGSRSHGLIKGRLLVVLGWGHPLQGTRVLPLASADGDGGLTGGQALAGGVLKGIAAKKQTWLGVPAGLW